MIDFEKLFAIAPMPKVLLDRNLTIIEMNRAYLDVTMRRRRDILGKPMFEAFPAPEDSDSYRQLMGSFERVLATGKRDEIALIRYDIEREDGGMDVRYWSATHVPLLDANGRVEYILQHTVDVTEIQELRELADEAGIVTRAREVERRFLDLSAESQLLKSLFEQAPGFVAVLSGPQHRFAMANDAYHSLVGYRELVGLPVGEALPEVVEQGFVQLLDQVRASGKPYVGREQKVLLLDGPEGAPRDHYLDFIYQPIAGADGAVTGIFVQGHDVTENVEARERQDLLINELNHRVKNTLAIVQSLAAQSFRQVEGGDAARETFEARLNALAAAHSMLTQRSWEETGLHDALFSAIAAAAGSDRSRVSLDGPEVALSPQTTVSLSMIVHELATNAIKYGALSSADGKVAIRWTVEGDSLHLHWAESGGPPVHAPSRSGFGTRLIRRGLSVDGRGSVDLRFPPGGVECDIVAGLPHDS